MGAPLTAALCLDGGAIAPLFGEALAETPTDDNLASDSRKGAIASCWRSAAGSPSGRRHLVNDYTTGLASPRSTERRILVARAAMGRRRACRLGGAGRAGNDTARRRRIIAGGEPSCRSTLGSVERARRGLLPACGGLAGVLYMVASRYFPSPYTDPVTLEPTADEARALQRWSEILSCRETTRAACGGMGKTARGRHWGGVKRTSPACSPYRRRGGEIGVSLFTRRGGEVKNFVRICVSRGRVASVKATAPGGWRRRRFIGAPSPSRRKDRGKAWRHRGCVALGTGRDQNIDAKPRHDTIR